MKKREVVLILHDIRSEHNVGSIFRTADASGVSKIYLTGYTAAPVDKFGREAKTILKTALGAEISVLWEKKASVTVIITKLKKEGFQIIAVEQSVGSINYKKIKIDQKVAFLFGNEVDGVPSVLLKKADVIAEIPMNGKKESLNVSVSAGIALFRMLNI